MKPITREFLLEQKEKALLIILQKEAYRLHENILRNRRFLNEENRKLQVYKEKRNVWLDKCLSLIQSSDPELREAAKSIRPLKPPIAKPIVDTSYSHVLMRREDHQRLLKTRLGIIYREIANIKRRQEGGQDEKEDSKTT